MMLSASGMCAYFDVFILVCVGCCVVVLGCVVFVCIVVYVILCVCLFVLYGYMCVRCECVWQYVCMYVCVYDDLWMCVLITDMRCHWLESIK